MMNQPGAQMFGQAMGQPQMYQQAHPYQGMPGGGYGQGAQQMPGPMRPHQGTMTGAAPWMQQQGGQGMGMRPPWMQQAFPGMGGGYGQGMGGFPQGNPYQAMRGPQAPGMGYAQMAQQMRPQGGGGSPDWQSRVPAYQQAANSFQGQPQQQAFPQMSPYAAR